MAITAPAPTFYFNNIIFNSSFYPSLSTSGFTQTQADARYLIKISSDTATSSENFNLGLTSLNVEPTAITGNLTIAGTQTTGNLVIGGNQTSGSINIGYNASASSSLLGTINIGTLNTLGSSQLNIYSGTAGTTISSTGFIYIIPSGGSTQISKLQANGIDTIPGYSGVLTIGGGNTTSIVLGSSATTSVSFSSGVTNLQLANNEFITLGANTSNPAVSSNIIGSIFSGTSSLGTSGLTTDTETTYSSIASVPIGVYVATASAGLTSSSASFSSTQSWLAIKIGSTVYGQTQLSPFTVATAVQPVIMSVSAILAVTAVSTINLNVFASFGSPALRGTAQGFNFRLVRIA